jgi:hypothetical protein
MLLYALKKSRENMETCICLKLDDGRPDVSPPFASRDVIPIRSERDACDRLCLLLLPKVREKNVTLI